MKIPILKFETVEIRTDDELTGNILWLSFPKDSVDFKVALMAAWIEAEEYPSHYKEQERILDFHRDEENFLYEEITVEEFLDRANGCIEKVYSHERNDLFNIIVNGACVNEPIYLPSIAMNATATVLENLETEYFVFIEEAEKYFLFLWQDVV